ncbi:MAG: TolC family protein [Dissulfurimicrobium sp.]|uniref:TolC family protein n=1 Tax=Dissulfurimicrobium sp. TaxID=2022436 RepID=UPI00404B250D
MFEDKELNWLEAMALEDNQGLKAAMARLEQAGASADVVHSGIFPHIGVSTAATRQRNSVNRPLNTTGQLAVRGYTYDNFARTPP